MVHGTLADPRVEFSAIPRNVMKYAEFMFEIGTIKQRPTSWKDVFFPDIHDLPVS